MSDKTTLKTEEKKEGPPVAVMTKENAAVETTEPKRLKRKVSRVRRRPKRRKKKSSL